MGAVAGALSPTPTVEVRSLAGMPLDARVDMGAIDRTSPDGECFGWLPEGSEPAGMDIELTIVEVRGRRTVKLESRAPIQAPRVRVALNVGCIPATRVTQVLEIALKSPAPTTITSTPVPKSTDTKRFADPGMTVIAREGDTLDRFAQLIYPSDGLRQAQLKTAIRQHNPDWPPAGDGEAIAPGTRIVFPDLKDLSGIAPAQTLAHPKVQATAPPMHSAANASRAKGVAPPAAKRVEPARPPVIAAPAPHGEVAPTDVRRPLGPQLLRLSAPEIDLSRTSRVSAKEREEIRQRRLLLDADDQMAAILSLQNAVRQLETRLQVLSTEVAAAKHSTNPPLPARDTIQLKPAQKVEPTPASAKPESNAAPGAAPATTTAKSESAPAIPPATKAEIPVPNKTPVSPSPKPEVVPYYASLMDAIEGWWVGVAGAGLLAILGYWLWTRRDRRPPSSKNPLGERAMTAHVGQAAVHAAASTPPSESRPAEIGIAPADAIETVRMPAQDLPSAPPVESGSVDESTERFDLDPTPAASLDLALDDRPDEDRVRRLQYMYERFPELMSRTVSIDDADSVINAARLYYEEGQADRACELLTFGIEERPQEVRFWLAQFEIFRLENRAADFSELAAKFHVLFSYSPSWPKVRHIGHELDPANPLFAAGRDLLAGDSHFDPVVENWLNSPMDFTADALLSDLRREIFDQFNVDRSDFDTLPTRMGEHR